MLQLKAMIKRLISQTWTIYRTMGLSELLDRIIQNISLKFRGVKAYQRPLTKCIGGYASTHPTFIDIGAAGGDIVQAVVGLFSGQVLAVEPAPHHIREPKRKGTEGLLGHAQIVECAVSSVDGRTKLGLSDTNPDDNSLFNRKDLNNFVEVEQKKLDNIITDLNVTIPAVIKMDVQGFEGHVLRGAKKALDTGCIVIMEFWPWGLNQAGTDPNELIQYIDKIGYQVKKLSGEVIDENTLTKLVRHGRHNKYVVADLLLTQKPELATPEN
jgi:FkbM family methyltransferase